MPGNAEQDERAEWSERVDCCCWEQLVAHQNARSGSAGARWIYRGHGQDSWSLQTSLERFCGAFDRLSRARRIEKFIGREFRRRYHHYMHFAPNRANRVEWWSIMQHHGAPTRLLDWTHSFLVAAYFALEKPFKPGTVPAIWALNVDLERAALSKVLNAEGDDRWTNRSNRNENRHWMKWFNGVLRRRISFVHSVTPFRLNERLTIQRGTFLCVGDVTRSFVQNLRGLKLPRNAIIRYVLNFSGQDRFRALDALNEMGISRATLFPGLDGFASSLNVFHRRLREVEVDAANTE